MRLLSSLTPIIPTALVAACFGLPLMAADMEVSDLRFGLGVLSNEFKGSSSTTITDINGNVTTGGSTQDGREASSNMRLQIQYVRGSLGSGGGLIYGVGVSANRATWDRAAAPRSPSSPSTARRSPTSCSPASCSAM